MSLIDAIWLGLVQGLTEFIPVSSSGHLIIANELFGLNSSFEFDVLLNMGTSLALLVYFRGRIKQLAISVTKGDKKLLVALVIATIPAVIIGGLFTDWFDNQTLRSSITIAIMLLVVGVLMIVIDRFTFKPKNIDKVSHQDGWLIGLAQVIALIPGTSRSGITMLAGKARGLSFKDAAEFSFLLGLPVLLGAVARVLLESDAREFITDNPAQFWVGNLVSFISGYVAVSFMISYLSKNGLKPFGYYRVALALILLILVI